MSLKDYQQKRNFKTTPEPPVSKSPSRKSAIFVVQEHWASHHHFDFRLEISGVLKSWALPKGLPQKVGEKRLAVQVEDHPLAYAQFTGTIPFGEYGAGKVEIWDKGQLIIKEKHKKFLKFTLLGKKLRGNFALFKPPTFAAKNWLLLRQSE